PVTTTSPERVIRSQYSAFAVCPGWVPANMWPADERVQIDNALLPRYQLEIHNARDTVITILSQAARLLPTSDFVAGQLVRFLVDQMELKRAAAVRCEATGWWCLALRGYVLARSADDRRADSVYQLAVQSMPPKVRCMWSDVSPLLDDATRKGYQRVGCAARDSFTS